MYKDDVKENARDFILDHKEMIIEALILENCNWDYNDIEGLDSAFHECIVDRDYSLTEAADIIANCENEESDSGLWEGQQPEQAICTKAAFSFGNDVWFECEKIFTRLQELYEEMLENHCIAELAFSKWKTEEA